MKIKCPICKNTTTWEENPNRPFCSKRCKLVDLGKWISEEYRVGNKEVSGEKQSFYSREQSAKSREQ